MAPRTDPIEVAIRTKVDQALRDLLSRTVKAQDTISQLQDEQPTKGYEWLRLEGKREGVNLVRGYIEESIRASQQDT